MSGGVDSSLAALLLKEKDYEVIGITLKLWDYSEVGGDQYKDGRCCSLESISDARNVCHKIGAPHYVLDFTEEFKQKVISNFVDEYKRGRTPNPCILCNTEIKWKLLWNKAKELGAEYLATGHYARIKYSEENKRFLLLKGIDSRKDQSYALWELSQENLSKTLFPLGELTKKETRELAKRYNLKTALKEESQEICFVPDDDYSRFLQEWTFKSGEVIKPGPVYDLEKNRLGEHKGIPFYTIGQRRGLNIAFGKPMYVVKIDPEENAIYVGENKDLFKTTFVVSQVNWISIPQLKSKLDCSAKIRYLHTPAKASISPFPEEVRRGQNSEVPQLVNFDLEMEFNLEADACEENARASSCTPEKVKVEFEKPERAITPGQSAVFYAGDKIIGGGIIVSTEE